MRNDLIESMLGIYGAELTQARYTPEYAKEQKKRKMVESTQRTKKKLDDEALLQKLEGFTAPEETSPPNKTGARRR